jgi:microcystin degradation protein MlrC
MKVFLAAMAHEASSFSPIPTNRASFEKSMYFRPGSDAPPEKWIARVGGSAYGEWVRLALERGHTVAAGLGTVAGPSAPTRRADYEALRDELLEDLRAAMPVDMVLLFLHGAQMAEGYDDCEGDVIRRVREIVGPETPIGVELDLHCNITQEMTDHATAIMACKEYPHTDFAAASMISKS